MTFKRGARIRETSTTTGTGTYTLAGAPSGFQAFSVLGANNTCPYFATDGVDWEEGIGTVLTGPNRLERTTVLASSNGGAAVNWAAGTRTLRSGQIGALGVPRRLSKDVAGGAGTTALTQNEQRVGEIEFTGALTGNRTIEVDATPWPWIAYNNTSGAYTLTVKVSGQTGIQVPQGGRALIYCDGTDVRDSSVIPVGTEMLFNQTSAPVGWVKSTTHNDKALRVVSGAVSSGGATAFTSVFGSGKVTGAHTLTTGESAAHQHGMSVATGTGVTSTDNIVGDNRQQAAETTELTASTGGGGSHDHTLSLDLQYVDVIIATRQ